MKNEAIRKFYLAYRLYIFPAVTGICCLILIAFIILPQFLSLLNLQKSEQQSLKRSSTLEAKAAELVNFNPEDIQKKVQIALNVLPKDKDYVGALAVIQNIVAKNSFVVNSLSPSGSGGSESGSGQSYGVRINITGPELLILSLIQDIENANRVMRVQSIEVSPQKDSSVVGITLAVDVLYSSVASQSSIPDSLIPKLTPEEDQLISKLSTQFAVSGPVQYTGGGARGKLNLFQ